MTNAGSKLTYTLANGYCYLVLRHYRCGCHIRQRVYQSGDRGREQIVWCVGCFGHRPQREGSVWKKLHRDSACPPGYVYGLNRHYLKGATR